jgi:hypothetical protein
MPGPPQADEAEGLYHALDRNSQRFIVRQDFWPIGDPIASPARCQN